MKESELGWGWSYWRHSGSINYDDCSAGTLSSCFAGSLLLCYGCREWAEFDSSAASSNLSSE